MKTYLPLERIIARVAKESNQFTSFKQEYNREMTLSNLDKMLHNFPSLPISLRTIFSYNTFFKFNMLYPLTKTYENINRIILELVKEHISDFFDKNNITDIFNKNLLAYHSNLSSKKINNIIEFIDSRLEFQSPFDLIIDSFSWYYTNEGFEFWKIINNNYRIFLCELLTINR